MNNNIDIENPLQALNKLHENNHNTTYMMQ